MNNTDQQSPDAWTEQELQEVKDKFNQLSPVPFAGILIHKKVRILEADQSLAAMFGYEPSELVDMTVLELSTLDGREIVLKNTFMKSEEPYEVIGLRKDGATFPIEIVSHNVAYQGRTIRVMAVREVTEHEQIEILAALQRTKGELEEESLPGTGPTTQLIYSNERLRLELDERAQMEAELRDRAFQQAAVAELGQRALVGTNLGVLMDEAVSLVAQTLKVEYAKLQQLLPDSNSLLLKAGVGWKEGFIGRALAEASADSQAGYTLLSSGPVIVEDIGEETRFKPSPLLQEHQVVSGMSVIIYGQKNPFGVLGAHTTRLRAFTEDDAHFLQAVANVLATAIENTRLHAETQRRAEQLAVLHELDRAITTSLRLTDIYHAFAQHAVRLLDYDRTSIALLEGEQMRITYLAGKNKDQTDLPVDTVLPYQGSAVGWVVAQGQPLLRHNIPADTRFTEDEHLIAGGIQSSMIMPLRVKGQVIGTWNIDQEQVGAYSPDDLDIAQSMADQLAIAIENARLFQKARQEIAERQRAEVALEEERALLAQRVAERTMDLMAANEELARAARLKDEFLASMSHELRTPLTAVLGMVEVLKMEAYGPLTKKQQHSIDVIEESGRHLLDLINDILDLSKIEADRLDLSIGPVAVDTVCQSSLQFIKQTAHQKDIKVSFSPDNAVSVLQADERRFKQILVNLLSNAVKFTPEGGEVGLEIVGDTTQQKAHLTIWDTGIGISPEDLERLFEPFVQLDSKLARQYSGTGLGLALVSRMVKMHDGDISVESEVGQGSRFTVSFPWSESAKTTETVEQAAEDASSQSKVWPISATKVRSAMILLAEDEESTAKLVTDYLQVSGYRVIVAENGVEALEQAREEKPDVILMDIQMPEMDGLEAITRLREDTEMSTVPIIALTALAMPGDRERCLAAGANGYFSKPVNLKQLVQAIETQIELRAG
jgi:PAS domain S-box-containing protein